MNMAEKTAVDRLYREAVAIIEVLRQAREISLEVSSADYFRKALLLAAASHFEHRVCRCVVEFVNEKTGGSTRVESFVRNKAVARQYHTWFSWEASNANQFFGLFGSEFRSAMSDHVGRSDDMQKGIRAFLEVGNDRNRLVHQDFATFPMEKTLEEIYGLYLSALSFVDALPAAFRGCDSASGRDSEGLRPLLERGET
jgi:RiboL-PSP-HEPN